LDREKRESSFGEGERARGEVEQVEKRLKRRMRKKIKPEKRQRRVQRD
jgi:hypothetical protein